MHRDFYSKSGSTGTSALLECDTFFKQPAQFAHNATHHHKLKIPSQEVSNGPFIKLFEKDSQETRDFHIAPDQEGEYN